MVKEKDSLKNLADFLQERKLLETKRRLSKKPRNKLLKMRKIKEEGRL